MLIDFLLIRRSYSINIFIRMLYGGRSISGVYWYTTCYAITLLFFAFLIKRYSNKIIKYLALIAGVLAVIESNFAEEIQFLQSPGIPWNADVALLAFVYMVIGYYNKDRIKRLISDNKLRIDIIALLTAIMLFIFCWINYQGERLYYFDMKPLFYKELVLAVVIPCAFGIVILRMVYWFDKINLFRLLGSILASCGQMTVPIMFMHVPLNTCKYTIGYGVGLYFIIGVCIPAIFTIIFGRFSIMRKLFGLPNLSQK